MKRSGKTAAMLPTQSIILFLICAAGILVFVFLIILPSQQLSAELDQDIIALKERIEEQRILVPIFNGLLAKTTASAPVDLPAPVKVRLTRSEIGKIPKTIQKIAETHGLAVKELTLDVNTVADQSGRVLVNFSARGQFLDFRRFLIGLAALPYFEALDEIEVNAVEGGEEMGLKILMARE